MTLNSMKSHEARFMLTVDRIYCRFRSWSRIRLATCFVYFGPPRSETDKCRQVFRLEFGFWPCVEAIASWLRFHANPCTCYVTAVVARFPSRRTRVFDAALPLLQPADLTSNEVRIDG